MILFDLCCWGTETWAKAAAEQHMELRAYSPASLGTPEQRAAAVRAMAEAAGKDKVVVLFSNHGMDKALEEFFSSLSGNMVILPVGSDAVLANRGNAASEHLSKMNSYAAYGGEENIKGAAAYIRKFLFEDGTAPEPPEPRPMPFDGIYSLTDDRVFQDPAEFLAAEKVKYPVYAGILSHRSFWLNHNLQVERAIAEALHQVGIGVIPVFSGGEKSELVQSYDFFGITEHYFTRNGKLLIQGLINFQMHLIKGEQGLSVSENSVRLFCKLNIPVFHPITAYFTNITKWKEDPNPLSGDIQSGYLSPEMAGMTEPLLVSVKDEKNRDSVLLQDNIQAFAGRVKKWMNLRIRKNSDKKLVLMLHNAVCSGVEATIGLSFGMDAFESMVRLLNRLKTEGYTVENIPENGKALRDLILEKKAFSDFRWTSVEDILASGGCLYRMPVHDEYLGYFHEFTPAMQQQMLDSWGPAPGEGMVMGDDLIITGIRFGNITVMVQPKRGCYGAKCTGEVCRILHDPNCPPAHQYIASYRYIERVLKADAVVHFGTEGSLEYLPGKSTGLSQESWPYAVLGSLPNLYPYHIGVTSEGTVAKRRTNGLMIGYYPAASSGFDRDSLQLMDRLNGYCEAVQIRNGQEVPIKEEILQLLGDHPAQMKLLNSADSFDEGVQLVRSGLLRCAEGRKVTELHVFGENPSHEEAVNYICEMLNSDGILERKEQEDEFDYHCRIHELVESLLADESRNDLLSEDVRRTYQMLMLTENEQDLLIRGLNGEYIPPSEGGMPDENGRKILPTGRNFYMMNMDKIPSREAYDRGMVLADQLLESYQKDEGKYPKKIAMNMISLDISRTHGEQMCQFLYLIGVRPVWDRQGRVLDLEVISPSELRRPRIDVTLRISGVMRDTWPDAVNLMDEAVMLVSSLDESEAENYILSSIHQMEQDCGELGDRAKTIRIFGDPPGAYGAGIDLALKASAWDSDRDLARYFIQSSAFAYGKGLNGRKSIREFVQNARAVELSCDVTSSRRMDTLACGFGLQVHGGFKLVAKEFGGKNIRQYQSTSELNTKIETDSLEGRIQKDIQQTLLNESWRDSVMRESYAGASDMMHRMQNIFDAKCTSDCIADSVLDELAETYINDEEMRRWMLENNPYAAEEFARRLLELQSRGRWQPDEELFEKLQENYLSIEGHMEGVSGGNGEIQGGSVEIVRDDQVENWTRNLRDIDSYLDQLEQK